MSNYFIWKDVQLAARLNRKEHCRKAKNVLEKYIFDDVIESNSSRIKTRLFFEYANALSGLGSASKAGEYYRKSQHIYKYHYNNNRYFIANFYYRRAYNLIIMGFYKKGKKLLAKAIKSYILIFSKTDFHVGNCLTVFARIYFNESNYSIAESFAKHAYKILSTNDNKSKELVACMNTLAMTFANQNKMEEAKYYLNEADIMIRNLVCLKCKYITIFNRACVEILENNYDKAEKLLIDLENDHEKVDDSVFIMILTTLGNLYFRKSNYKVASDYSLKALNIAEENLGKRNTSICIIYNDLGMIDLKNREFDASLRYFKMALLASKSINYLKLRATIYNNMGILYCKTNNHRKSLHCYNKSLRIRKLLHGIFSDAVAQTYNNFGMLYSKTHPRQAKYKFLRAVVIYFRKLYSDSYEAAYCLMNLAVCKANLGETNDCLELIIKAGEIIKKELLRVFSFSTEKDKLTWLVKNKSIYSHSITMLSLGFPASQIQIGKIWELLLFRKCIIKVFERLQNISHDLISDKDAENSKNMHTMLKKRILQYNNIYNKDYYKNINKQIVKSKSKEFLDEIYECEQRLSSATVKLLERVKSNVNGADSILNEVNTGQIVIDYYKYKAYDFKSYRGTEEKYFAFYFFGGSKCLQYVDIGFLSEIDNTVDCLRNLVLDIFDEEDDESLQYDFEKIKYSYEEINRVSSSLSSVLFKNILDNTRRIKKIIVSTDGKLCLFPFDLLLRDNSRIILQYLSNMNMLAYHKKDYDMRKWSDAYIFADPSFGKTSKRTSIENNKQMNFTRVLATNYEAKCVSNCLREINVYPKLFTGSKASKANFINLKKPDVLHVATHSYLGLEKEMTSDLQNCGLAFACANRGEGLVSAWEISQMNFVGTELVFLNACDTGVGKISDIEGVYSLERAFEIAGASTIIISIWPLPDSETCKLAEQYYLNLIKGRRKIESLQIAKEKVRNLIKEKYGFDHPYFWAGLIGYGED